MNIKLNARLLAAIFIVSFITFATYAHAGSNWAPSSNYLKRETGRVYYYENTTGILTDIGPSTVQFTCTPQLSETHIGISQCGECEYVGLPPSGWENNNSEYVYGVCATIDARSPSRILARLDVQVVSELGDAWRTQVLVKFMRHGQKEPLYTEIYEPESCEFAAVAWCDNGVRWVDVSKDMNVAGADYFCSYGQIIKSTLPNPERVVEPKSCFVPTE